MMHKPVLLTIFGGTGDLTFRKLLPALYNMYGADSLPEGSQILIIGRRPYSSEEFRELARSWVERFARLPYTGEQYQAFSRVIEYFRMDIVRHEEYHGLAEYFHRHADKELIFYFAVAPHFFAPIAEGLSMIPAARNGKLVLEKPFGVDLEEARRLNARLEELFTNRQIYRIDHYLGKEMVRAISALRFTNPIFNYIWDGRQIEYIEISALEAVGVETRGDYYDKSGALSDMVQNHLFQIMSILAMERPSQFYGPELKTEQLRVLRALRMPSRESVHADLVLGQYEGYREEPKVSPDSQTETFVSLRVFIDNDRWRNMPFYITTGKKTGVRDMTVNIAFRSMGPDIPRNTLTIHIQPTEGVCLRFNMKEPGETENLSEARMEFSQSCNSQSQSNTPEAYERLLASCIQGEQSWFSQWEQIEAGWKYVETLKACAAQEQIPILPYAQGKVGPAAAEQMKRQFGHGAPFTGRCRSEADCGQH